MLPLLPCKLCIIHHGMLVCLSHLFICLCTVFMLALACLVFLRIDTKQGVYQETRSTTQILLSRQLSCQASTTTCLHTYSTYCLHLILASLSCECINLNPKY